MPKELRWKVILIAIVLIMSLISVYPVRDTLVYTATVTDTLNDSAQPILSKRVFETDKDIASPIAYHANKLLFGIFHSFKEKYDPPTSTKLVDGKSVVTRRIEVYLRGMTLGLDLTGGAELLYNIQFGAGEGSISSKAGDVKSIIEKRVDAMGLQGPIVQLVGNRRLLVQVPQTKSEDIERVRRVIEGTGHLEFRLVCKNDAILKSSRPGEEPPAGYHWYRQKALRGEGRWELISDSPPEGIEVTGDMVTNANLSQDDQGRVVVLLDFNARGRWNFYQVTSAHVGEQLAIILDDIREGDKITRQGTLYSAPVIQTAISGRAEISGQFTYEEAETLRTVLMAGSLPAALQPAGVNQVGATLGDDSIRAGQQATVIGVVLVLMFMAGYYLWGGAIADFAVLLNVVMLMGMMAVLGATLTLPGIAGIALTVGMAVDANVLIFERMREEQARKADKPLLAIIRDGYHRAMSAIVDSNLTTIITGVVLLLAGSGPVRGFAITLTGGILISMFTALFVTRTITEWLVMTRRMKKVRMLQLFGKTSISFMAIAPKAVIGSIIVIGIGLACVAYRGKGMLDTDFTGGTRLHVVMKEEVDASWVRDQLSQIGLGKSEVQSLVASKGEEAAAHSEFLIRTPIIGTPQFEDISPIPQAPEGTAQPDEFAGGLKVTVSTDMPVIPAQLQDALKERGHLAARVAPLGDLQDGRAVRVEVRVKSDNEAVVKQNVQDAFTALSVRSVVEKALEEKLADTKTRFASVSAVGPSAALEMQIKALVAVLISFIGIIFYVWFRFELIYGVAGVVALVHDVAITLGALALFGYQINLNVLAGILTIIGYSINDTIVVYDRIRENLGSMRREKFDDVCDISVNQTLSRTTLTSMTTLFAVVALFIWGGEVIHGLTFALLVGIITGTYSSVFIASAMVAFVRRRQTAGQRVSTGDRARVA